MTIISLVKSPLAQLFTQYQVSHWASPEHYMTFQFQLPRELKRLIACEARHDQRVRGGQVTDAYLDLLARRQYRGRIEDYLRRPVSKLPRAYRTAEGLAKLLPEWVDTAAA